MTGNGAASSASATSVSASRVVPASPAEVFDLLAHPARHPEIDGSGTLRRATSGPDRLWPGARFGMAMRWGAPYRMRNVVVEFDEGRRIGWRHVGRHVWRYELEPVDGGTLVTETVDWSGVPAPLDRIVAAQAGRNARSIEHTLERLAQRFT